MNMMKNLKTFISMQTVSGNQQGNQQAIDFLAGRLKKIGFNVNVEGQDKTDQPIIIAHRQGIKSQNKIALYGHYDVAKVTHRQAWKSQDPFTLECIDNRLFARGVADNKGTLEARLSALEATYQQNGICPEILWMIQGEEEVVLKERVAIKLFHSHITKFGANVFLDETGFNDIQANEQIVFLWSKTRSQAHLSACQKELDLSGVFTKPHRFEYRHLNKLTGTATCPLLSNLPEKALYLGFGPNDKFHYIHRDNESLDKEKWEQHQKQFTNFLIWYAKINFTEFFSFPLSATGER